MSAAPQRPRHGPAARVWERVCRHCDGVAVGSTLVALERGGVLRHLLSGRGARLADLAERFAANPGPLQVALRLLSCQGWLQLHAESGSADLEVEITGAGAQALPQAAAFEHAVEALRQFQSLAHSLLGTTAQPALAWRDLDARMAAEWGLDATIPAPIRHQLLHQLDGHVIVPLMHLLAESGALPTPLLAAVQPAAAAIDTTSWDGGASERRAVLAILGRQGWLAGAVGEPYGDLDDCARLSQEGVAAAGHVGPYGFPMCYRPLLLRVPELLFGNAGRALGRDAGGDEVHVDRGLDIRISGGVLSGVCRNVFLAAALPLFDRSPLDEQPTAVVDTGSGDGTLLVQLWRAVRSRSLRGRHLRERPLLMVGVERNRIAREATAAALGGAGVPCRVLEGDIGEPETIARSLAERGIDPDTVLHVSKSVIHNRRPRGAAVNTGNAPARVRSAPTMNDDATHSGGRLSSPLPCSHGAFMSRDGRALAAEIVVGDLCDHLVSWRRVAHRHGMIVIETHTTAPESVEANLGRTFQTIVDATHGYSCQYQVEPEVFAAAAAAAGWASLAHYEIGRPTAGHVFMTVDHFVVVRDD